MEGEDAAEFYFHRPKVQKNFPCEAVRNWDYTEIIGDGLTGLAPFDHLHFLPNLHSLGLQGILTTPLKIQSALSHPFPALTRLDLSSNVDITSELLSKVAENCPDLETLL
ncbi:hypothetical protein HK097_005051 [Rhizophlyctis rosea]|uniref:Uncharacterized protein n=1 Tax=Rhizophlyctis rosea TaxID=64517 RepID=A0AAD5S0R5_9FUNG|nr:hypothetical protein HK097_005051 [Rhizophlyctis rosea]